MKVMVTGGTGFIGSFTAAALIEAGHEVRLLVRSQEKMVRVFENHELEIEDFVIGDVTDPNSVAEALEGCDAVVHSAALVATADKYADEVWQTNVEGTINVIDQALALGIERIIHVSSITALFDPKARVVSETSPPGQARNAYGRSKVACEEYIRGLQEGGAPVKITYPTGTIGPCDPGLTEPIRGLKLFLTTCAVVTTTGIQYVDVRDVADAHVMLLEADPKPDRFMLGGTYHRWYELVDLLEEITGRKLIRLHMIPPVLTWLGKTMDMVTHFTGFEGPFTEEAVEYATHWSIASNRKIEDELGFEFRDPKDSLIDTIIWLYEAGHLEDDQIGDLLEE